MKALIILLSILPWQSLLQEAKQHYMNYENDSCVVKITKVREYCLSHPNENGVLELSADVENVLGAIAQVEGKRDSSAMHYKNAYDYAMRLENRSKTPMYCINLADILRQDAKAPEAAQWLRRALTLSDSLSNDNLKCAINTQLGQIYADLRNFQMAETYFDAAATCCPKGSFDEHFLCNAMGNARFFEERYKEAIPFFRRAREVATELGNILHIKIAELNIGECYLSLHQLDSAELYINKAYEFWTSENYSDESILTAIRGMKAGLALEKGKINEAAKWLSYRSDGAHGTSPIYTNAFNKHMMEISVLKSDWKSAFDYCQKLRTYSDSVSRNTLESNFIEAQMRYARDTTVLNQQVRILEQGTKISRMEVWILVCVLLLFAAAEAIILIQRARKKEQLATRQIIDGLKLENLSRANMGHKITVEEASGDRYVTIGEMVLFTYQPDSRRWQILLKDGSCALMKRSHNANSILALSSSFSKLNPGSIVNMDYIKSIGAKDQTCVLVEPFSSIKLSFSRRSAASVKQRN